MASLPAPAVQAGGRTQRPGSVPTVPGRGWSADPAHAPPQLAGLMASALFAGRIGSIGFTHRSGGIADYAIVIPVRNEMALLPRALAALGAAMDECGHLRGIVICVVNDSDDGSAELFDRWAQLRGADFALADLSFAEEIRDAPHARRFAMDLATQFAPDGAILSTDADSHVAPGWIARYIDGLAAGHDLLCEDVRLDEDELAGLPDRVRAVGEAERRYFEISEQLWERWTRGRAGPFAIRASGASLAIRSPVYRSLGGLPTPRSGEDAALAAAARAAGCRIMNAGDIGTRTSARLHGRAAGGCGEALRARARKTDPECDSVLVPLTLLRNLAARAIATENPLSNADTRKTSAHPPMTVSQIRRELLEAERLLAERPAS